MPANVWTRTQLLYVCSPDNPTGRVMPQDEWRELFALSDRYGFVIASDECYSEIYFDEAKPPLGALAAAQALGRDGYPRLVVFGSLSKRSNAPGLRSGYVAGDRTLIKRIPAIPDLSRIGDVGRRRGGQHRGVERRSARRAEPRRVCGEVRRAAAALAAGVALRDAGGRVLPVGENARRRRSVRAAPAGRGERDGAARQLSRARRRKA